jgi:hypothetical protein
MIGSSEHPSFLELDAYALEGRGAVGRHVESCATCRRHVDAVRAPVETPEWVGRLPSRRRSFARWFPILGGAGALVTAALAAFLVAAPESHPPQAQAVHPKGPGPSVIVHLKRAGQVSQWRGGERLQRGDVLRLEIAPDGFRRVRVTSPTASGEAVLFSGSIEPRAPTLLPVGLQIDGASRTERLRITLEDPLGMSGGSAQPRWEKTLTFELEAPP